MKNDNKKSGVSSFDDEKIDDMGYVPKKAKKRKNTIVIVLLCFLGVIIVLFSSGYLYTNYLLEKPYKSNIEIRKVVYIEDDEFDHLPDYDDENISPQQISNADDNINVESSSNFSAGNVRVYVNEKYPIQYVKQIDPNVENILIFGVDARNSKEVVCRADTIIVASIDKRNNKVKLTSIMRDTAVNIPGRTNDGKINSSYAYGGAGLLINTINQNFNLDIQKFAMVDFMSAEQLVDIAGGVDIAVQENELKWLNQYITDLNYHFPDTKVISHIDTAGTHHLCGRQAVAWARIRYIGNDNQRTQRQRTVIEALINEFWDISLAQKIAMVDSGMGMFETNMQKDDIKTLMLDVISNMDEVEQYCVPETRFTTTNMQNYNIIVDFDKQLPALKDFIYE